MPPDADLFRGTAWYYHRFRPGYPEAFFELLRAHYQLDGRGRLLDLGCGTGFLTLPFAEDFESILAVDPEPEMLAEARRAAEAAGITHIEFREDRSENLSAAWGQFRLVTIGRAFHWMDRAQVLEALYDMVEPRGGVVITADPCLWGTEGDFKEVVLNAIRVCCPQTEATQPTAKPPPEQRHEAFIARARFAWTHEVLFVKRDWTIESLIGLCYSTSYANQRLLGQRRAEFEARIREGLSALNPAGQFTESIAVEIFLLTRAA